MRTKWSSICQTRSHESQALPLPTLDIATNQESQEPLDVYSTSIQCVWTICNCQDHAVLHPRLPFYDAFSLFSEACQQSCRSLSLSCTIACYSNLSILNIALRPPALKLIHSSFLNFKVFITVDGINHNMINSVAQQAPLFIIPTGTVKMTAVVQVLAFLAAMALFLAHRHYNNELHDFAIVSPAYPN